MAHDWPIVHLYAQDGPHEPTCLAVNAAGLEALRKLVAGECVVSQGDAGELRCVPAFAADGEGYMLGLVVSEATDDFTQHYADTATYGDWAGKQSWSETVWCWLEAEGRKLWGNKTRGEN